MVRIPVDVVSGGTTNGTLNVLVFCKKETQSVGSRRSKSEVSGDPPTTHPLAVTPPDHLPRQTCRFVHPGTVSRKVVLYGPHHVP